MMFGSGVTNVASERNERQFEKVAKHPGINSDGLGSAKRMLLSGREYVTTVFVNIISISSSASLSPRSRLAEDASVEKYFSILD